MSSTTVATTPPTASFLASPLTWMLQGPTLRLARCTIARALSGLWLVTVKLQTETMMEEAYPDSSSARFRASSLKTSLLATGWLEQALPSGAGNAPRRAKAATTRRH